MNTPAPGVPDYLLKTERSIGQEMLEQVLGVVRNVSPAAWQGMTEAQQLAVIDPLRRTVETCISQLVATVAGRGRQAVTCDVDSVTYKKRVSVKLSLPRGAAAGDLAQRAGSQIVVVLADSADLLEGVERVKPDKGQTDAFDH